VIWWRFPASFFAGEQLLPAPCEGWLLYLPVQYSLEHSTDLSRTCPGNLGDYILHKMHHTALVLGLGEDFSNRLNQAKAFISHNHSQTALGQMPKEGYPALNGLFAPFASSDYSRFPSIHAQRNQNNDVLNGSAPVLFQVDAIQKHGGIGDIQLPIMPCIYLEEYLFALKMILYSPFPFKAIAIFFCKFLTNLDLNEM
jgi:hypothetical protein